MKIYSALILLERGNPELFSLIRKVKIDVVPDTVCPSARVYVKDGVGFALEISQKYFDQLDPFSLAALIEHELLHVVLGHLLSEQFQKIREEDPLLLNVAMDAVINSIGDLISQRKNIHDLLKGGIFMEDLNKEYNLSLSPVTHSTLDIYHTLKRKTDALQKAALGSKSFDQGLVGDPTGAGDLGKELMEKVGELLDSGEAKQAVDELLGRKAGSSTDIKRILEKIKAKEKSEIFKKAVSMFLSSRRSTEHKSSWKRLSRRFPGTKGKIRTKTQKVLLGIDTSASMLTEETLKKIKTVIVSATSKEFCVDLVCGDTKKTGFFKDINESFDFKKVKGGGGTDLGFMFKGKEDYDCTIVVTDGEFDHSCIPEDRVKTSLFLLTCKYPMGKKYRQIEM